MPDVITLPPRIRPGFHSDSVEFLRRRFAEALIKGDDRTAARLRVWLDRALNGPRPAPSMSRKVK